MKRIIFCPPDGGDVVNPRIELVKQAVFDQLEEYWLRGCAQAGLHYFDGAIQSQLIIRFREKFGFCVYFEKSPHDIPLVQICKEGPRDIVEIEECGNILKLPRHYFISPECAWTTVSEFMRTGRADTGANWTVFSPAEL